MDFILYCWTQYCIIHWRVRIKWSLSWWSLQCIMGRNYLRLAYLLFWDWVKVCCFLCMYVSAHVCGMHAYMCINSVWYNVCLCTHTLGETRGRSRAFFYQCALFLWASELTACDFRLAACNLWRPHSLIHTLSLSCLIRMQECKGTHQALMSVLGFRVHSHAWAASIINHWAISPAKLKPVSEWSC